ncbi:MAG: alpha/beta fold hydrolase [Phycisphaerae bacterium]|nr:alpha/beta fold hydrolase [Phycisphaerae bacterium]
MIGRFLGDGTARVRRGVPGPKWGILAFLPVLVLAAGCGMTIPYASVLATLPPQELLLIDGQWVHVERAGEGEPVVFIHGFGASTFSWREVLPEVAKEFGALGIDLNGFGYTERPEEESAYSLRGQADLVLGVMNKLECPTAHVVGHSYGAGVALTLALQNPDRVRSLVLVDGGVTASDAGAPSIPPLFRPLAEWLIRGLFLTERNIRGALESAVYDPATVTSDMVKGYLRPLRVEGFDRAFRGLLAAGDGPMADLDPAEVAVPTLVLWGENDPFFPLSAGQALADEIPGAALVVFPMTGHLPMEERPSEFNSALLLFLKQNP